jgi:8-oxo-dGTP pyrophosphatase MutT (NUDIX family)
MTIHERLRQALNRAAPSGLLAGDLAAQHADPKAPAAVLVAVTDRAEPGVILTVRRDNLRTHAGQIAFPGGRIDDGEDAIGAALREAWEEIGLDGQAVHLIGTMDEYRTITGYLVTPVVGVIPPDLPLEPHELEVADWFEAPLDFLVDPANRRLESVAFAGEQRHYYVIEWNGRRIWGATAAMLVNLSQRLWS